MNRPGLPLIVVGAWAMGLAAGHSARAGQDAPDADLTAQLNAAMKRSEAQNPLVRGLPKVISTAQIQPDGSWKRYTVNTYNCHSFANQGDIYIDEARGRIWGVFACQGISVNNPGSAVNDPVSGHTVNWTYDKSGKRMCIIEPQNPVKRSCWSPTPKEIKQRMPDVYGSEGAQTAAKLLCGGKDGEIGQYHPPDREGFCSAPLPPGKEAAQPGPGFCAKITLGANPNQTEIVVKALYEPGAPETVKLGTACRACCVDNAAKWYSGDAERLPGAGKEGAVAFLSACDTSCETVFPSHENADADPGLKFAANAATFGMLEAAGARPGILQPAKEYPGLKVTSESIVRTSPGGGSEDEKSGWEKAYDRAGQTGAKPAAR
jgi:hypothetical protein